MDVGLKLGIGRGLSDMTLLSEASHGAHDSGAFTYPIASVRGTSAAFSALLHLGGDLKIWEEPLGSEADSSSIQLERSP